MKKIKFISVILLSLVLIFTISTAVLADNDTDDNPWLSENDVSNNEEADNNIISDENNTSGEDFNIEENNEADNLYDNLYDDDDNSTGTNAENLADTGLNDSKGVVTLIIFISSIVAIYSAIKIKDYNNL